MFKVKIDNFDYAILSPGYTGRIVNACISAPDDICKVTKLNDQSLYQIPKKNYKGKKNKVYELRLPQSLKDAEEYDAVPEDIIGNLNEGFTQCNFGYDLHSDSIDLLKNLVFIYDILHGNGLYIESSITEEEKVMVNELIGDKQIIDHLSGSICIRSSYFMDTMVHISGLMEMNFCARLSHTGICDIEYISTPSGKKVVIIKLDAESG